MLHNTTKHNNKNMGGIKFQDDLSFIKISDREYGLMRVTQEKGHTPYPKAKEPLDANMLRARLSAEQKNVVELDDIMDENNKPEMSKFKKYSFSAPKPSLCTSQTRIDTTDKIHNLKSIASSAGKHVLIGVKSDEYINPYNKSDISSALRSVEHDMLEAQDSYKSLLQRRSFVLLNDSPHSSLSFYQQRKEFDMAEFNIAKNGKKMSEFMMDASQHKYEIADKKKWVGYDEEASEKINRYIEKVGMFKGNADNMTGFIRSLSEEGISLTPKTVM